MRPSPESLRELLPSKAHSLLQMPLSLHWPGHSTRSRHRWTSAANSLISVHRLELPSAISSFFAKHFRMQVLEQMA
jgi:hypothetical protein